MDATPAAAVVLAEVVDAPLPCPTDETGVDCDWADVVGVDEAEADEDVDPGEL